MQWCFVFCIITLHFEMVTISCTSLMAVIQKKSFVIVGVVYERNHMDKLTLLQGPGLFVILAPNREVWCTGGAPPKEFTRMKTPSDPPVGRAHWGSFGLTFFFYLLYFLAGARPKCTLTSSQTPAWSSCSTTRPGAPCYARCTAWLPARRAACLPRSSWWTMPARGVGAAGNH